MAAFFLKGRSTKKAKKLNKTMACPVQATPMGSVETGGLGTGSPVAASGLGEISAPWHWSPPANLIQFLGAHHAGGKPGAERWSPLFSRRAERRGSSGL